jgi:hypothetical protein
MAQNSSRRWPVREQWDVENTASYDDECDGGSEPARPEILHADVVETSWPHRTAERRHNQRLQWRGSPVFVGRPSRQDDGECDVQSHTRDWLATQRQYEQRVEALRSAHAGDHRDDNHYKPLEQLDSAPRQTPWRSLQRATANERAPMLKREAVKPWLNRTRTNWPSHEDWPRSTRQARTQAAWRPNTAHPSYSFAGDPECEGDVSEWANNEAPHSPIESNAPNAPCPRWWERNGMRLQQRHWPERSTAAGHSSARRHLWASTPSSEWQSTRSSAVEQDQVVLRPDMVGESRLHNDSNLSAIDRQRHERRKFSANQDSSSRQAAMGLPAWAIAPATSSGPASDDDTGGGGDVSLLVRLSYEQRSDGDDDDDDDESDGEDFDDHEFELESKRQSRVSALGKTKARAEGSATATALPGAVVLGSSKRKQAAGQRNNGGAGSSKRRKGSLCRFDGGCDNRIQSNGLCTAHGGGKRCQHAGGCGKVARSPSFYCIAHGGGKRCQHAGGCENGAQGTTSFCFVHGGGKRCQHAGGCEKSAVSPTLFCVAHGGGKRCQHAGGCGKSARSSTAYCKAHGGGPRCQHAGGCSKHVVRKKLCKRHGMAAGVWD